MHIHNLLIITLCALLMATSKPSAQEQITPQDIKRFGWEYLGETIKMYAYLKDVYACRQPSNRGKICAYMEYQNKIYQGAIFAKGIRSKTIRPLLGKCVEMIGTIVEADTKTQGAMTAVPILNIENIAPLSHPHCIIPLDFFE